MEGDRRPSRSFATHAAAIGVLLCAIAIRFHRLVLEGISSLEDEMADEYLPLAWNVFTHIRRGEFPLWSPEILFGYPASLTVDLHVFSPFSWPFLVWPPHAALAAQMLSVQVCAALCLYALARRAQASVFAATCAAILWIAGCPADNMILISMGLATLPWIPLVVLCFDHYAHSLDLRWAAVSGGVLGLAMLGGHMQFVYWTVVFLVGYVLLVLRPLPEPGRLAWLTIEGTTVLCVVALAVAAVLVLPMTAILEDSIRSSLAPHERIHTGTMSLAETWRALRFTVFCAREHYLVEGDVEFRSAGVLPVALALLAWGRGRRFDNRLLALGLLFLVLSLGAVFAPSNGIVKLLPFNNFRYPARIALFFTLPVGLLAARGLDRLSAGAARNPLNLVALGTLAALCAPLVRDLLRSVQAFNMSEGRRDVASFVCLGLALAIPGVGRLATRSRQILSAAAVLSFLAHSAVITNPPNPWAAARAWGANAGVSSRRPGEIGPFPPPYLERVPRGDAHGPTRMLHLDTTLEHDVPMVSGHQAPTGLVSLRPARVDRLVYGRFVASDNEAAVASTIASRQPLLDLFNVQYLVLDPARFDRHFDAEQRGRSVVIRERLAANAVLVENRTRLPRSFFLTHARVVPSEGEARARVTDPGFDPRRELVLERSGPAEPPVSSEPVFQPTTVVHYENDRVELHVAAPCAGWVVLLDRWAPGWSATLNGAPVVVERADYLFRAVRVPVGTHRIVFEYRNRLFRWGLGLSAAGVAVAVTAAASLWRSRRRP